MLAAKSVGSIIAVALVIAGGGCLSKKTSPAIAVVEKESESAHVVSAKTQFTTNFPADLTGKRAVRHLCLSRDGRIVVAANTNIRENKTQIWDVAAKAKKPHDYEGKAVALSPDGKRLARWGKAVNQEVVETGTGKILGELKQTGDHVFFTSNDTIVVMHRSNDWSKAAKFPVHRYEAATGKLIDSTDASDDNRVSISSPVVGGKQVLLAVEKQKKVRVWGFDSKALVREFSLPDNNNTLWSGFTVSADVRRFAVLRGQDVEILDGETGAAVGKVTGYVSPYESFR